MATLRISAAILALGLCGAACGSRTDVGSSATTAPTTVIAQVDESDENTPQEVDESATQAQRDMQESFQGPEWAGTLRLQLPVESDDGIPTSLALVEEFADPGLNYRISVAPSWDFVGSVGLEEAPVSEWRLNDSGLVRLRVGSLPTSGVPFEDFIQQTVPSSVEFLDGDTAASTEIIENATTGEMIVIRLFRFEVDRIAFAQLTYPSDQGNGVFLSAIPYLESLTRTPYGQDDAGAASAEQIEIWVEAVENANGIGELGTPEEIASCIADGLVGRRLSRYSESDADLGNVDPDDEQAALTAGNYLADIEELTLHCGLPPQSLGYQIN